ncbi:hypothetical protein M408DRAFT_189572 [Serendipita vermifera MAFF 305830]|uniref:Uncharacterized protein n=1 Tax=Serendipita vermifera MAFF 305830 TaxID=933852 RepID=A0A0C3BNA8_SERVB|nr:hypothetical protein M408DRAFT_189572 [Serendipita vermifera MAFF 305830]
MLPFLLPDVISGSRATNRASNGLRSLIRRHQRIKRATPSSSRSFAEAAEEHEGANESESSRKQGEHTRWLLTQGQQYRRPNENGPNWLGGSVPFPMNPSFKPPTPISDKVRTQIFNLYMNENMGEQELSSRFGLGVSRVKAILRLKKLEQLWIKDRVCQRRFQADMERYLGVPAPSAERDRPVVKDRQVSNQIDVDFDKFSIGKSKHLQRVFFEVVPEGEYPPLAQYMDMEEAVAEQAEQMGATEKAFARARALVVVPASTLQKDGTPSKPATRYQWFYPNRAGRAPHTFVDVGHRYLQKSDTLKEEQSLHVSAAEEKNADQKHQLGMAREAHKLRVAIQSGKDELVLKSKAARIRDKRQGKAEEELALARSKVVDVNVTL